MKKKKTPAVVFTAPQKVEFQELDVPHPGEEELLVRATVTGISVGTERWALLGKRPELKYPNVPGYLGVGVIEETGSRVHGFREGERIFYFRARLGEPHCSHSWMSTHAARVVVPTTRGDGWPPYVCKIPADLDDATAAMTGLAAVAVEGADMLRITSHDTAVVLGLGMIGQCAVQVLRARGARVIAADRLATRVEQARACGCEVAVPLESGPIAPQLKDHLPPRGADIVVDTTSVAPVVQQLAGLVRERGQILLQGYYPDLTPMDLDALHVKRPTISVACSQSFQTHDYAHRLMSRGALTLDPLITHRFAAADASQAYQMILDRPQEFLGVALDWSNN